MDAFLPLTGDYYMSRFIFKPSTNIQHNSNFGKISIYADAPREKKIPTLPFDEDGDLMLERNNADAMVENFEVLTIGNKTWNNNLNFRKVSLRTHIF